MKIGTIQSLACVGLGAVLGFVAATRGVAPPARADGATPAARQVVKEAQTTETEASRPASCSEGVARNVLLARAGAETTTARAASTASGKKPNIVVIMGDDVGSGSTSAPITGA